MFIFLGLGNVAQFRHTTIHVSFPLSCDSWPVARHTQAISCSLSTLSQVCSTCKNWKNSFLTVKATAVEYSCFGILVSLLDLTWMTSYYKLKDYNTVMLGCFKTWTAFNLLNQHAFPLHPASVWLHIQTECFHTAAERTQREKVGFCEKTNSRKLDLSWPGWEGTRSTFLNFYHKQTTLIKYFFF